MNFDMIYKYNFQVLSSSSSQNNFYNNHTSQCTNAIYQLHKRSMLLLPYILRWIEDTILGPRNHLDQHWDRVSVQSTPPNFDQIRIIPRKKPDVRYLGLNLSGFTQQGSAGSATLGLYHTLSLVYPTTIQYKSPAGSNPSVSKQQKSLLD